MERVMSVEDKIRRAEERYYQKRGNQISINEPIRRSNKGKKDIKLFKKMIRQIIICLIIYGMFYAVINNNYVFSEDFTKKAKEILSQDINISQIYSNISNTINGLWQQMQQLQETNSQQQEEQKQEENQEEQLENKEPEQTQEPVAENIQNNDENIGGAEEIPQEEPIQLSQMEQDAEYIKSTVSFIKPVTGSITSPYGERNPTTPTVPKNHTGTDIGAETGTKIVSATDGTVILASSQGDYGNHLKIQINDIIIVYAHCNKLYVKEGDTIKQGQEIAEVGSTGNATGPHLHFEVRYQNRYVNPQLILDL